MPVPAAERPPSDLTSRWAATWKGYLAVMKAQKSWKPEQREFLNEMVYALRDSELARQEAQAHPFTGGERVVTDKRTGEETVVRDRVYAHPGFAIADQAVRRATVLAKVLRLTLDEQERGASGEETAPADPFKELDGNVTRLRPRASA
jgi:hypothetical protein